MSLVLLGLVYQIKGHVALIAGQDRGDAIDLEQKWVEHRYFVNGVNPYDVWLEHGPRQGTPEAFAAVARRGPTQLMDGHRLADPASPPWSYLPSLAWFWPSWAWARVYYSVLNLAASLIIAVWAWDAVRRHDPGIALLIGLSTFCFGSTVTALEVGQLTVLTVAWLAVSVWIADTRPGLSGAAWMVSLMKPTISGPFVLPFLLTGRYRPLIVAGNLCAVSCLVTYAMVRTDPLEMLRQLGYVGEYLSGAGASGLTSWLARAGVSPRLALWIPAAGVMLFCLTALVTIRRASLLSLFAVAAVAGRLWTYHRSYDDGMLVFLLVACGAAYGASRRPLLGLATLAVFGSLVLPGFVLALPGVGLLQISVWVLACVILVACEQHRT